MGIASAVSAVASFGQKTSTCQSVILLVPQRPWTNTVCQTHNHHGNSFQKRSTCQQDHLLLASLVLILGNTRCQTANYHIQVPVKTCRHMYLGDPHRMVVLAEQALCTLHRLPACMPQVQSVVVCSSASHVNCLFLCNLSLELKMVLCLDPKYLIQMSSNLTS